LSDSTGARPLSYLFTAYGKPISVINNPYNRHRFGGKYGYYFESIGPVLAWHRWYYPYAYRWASRDPIGYDGGDNTYAYVSGNPVMWVDPDGLAPLQNNSEAPIRIKPEDGPAWPPSYCMPGQNCDVDGWYKFDTQCPGGNVSGGEKIPNNCAPVMNADGTVTPNCRLVSPREICEHKGWGYCELYPDWRTIPNSSSPVINETWRKDWNPYGPGDPRRQGR